MIKFRQKTQKELIMDLLHEKERVSSFDLTYRYGIKQAPTRIHELKKRGENIISLKIDNKTYYSLNK